MAQIVLAGQLSKSELLVASSVGCMRQIAALSRGLADKHGASVDSGWQMHVDGAIGELCVCKAMGWYWPATVNTFHAPDARDVFIRCRTRHSYELIVREPDPDGVYVLVTYEGLGYVVRGWREKRDVVGHGEWWKTHGGRPGAWFVPHDALRPMELLRVGG